MYFGADAGAGFHIWRQRFPDGTAEQVTAGTSEEEGIEFAPDGRSFLTSIGTRQNTLWIHDARGDRQVTSEAYAFLPSFSADGKKLYYLVRAGGGMAAWGARTFPVPGAFLSPNPSVYAFSKISAQRNIYRVPVP